MIDPSARPAGARRRLARQRLARLVSVPAEAPPEGAVADAEEIVLRLTAALVSEQWRGAVGDWSFRPIRLRALHHALARARADLRRIRREAGLLS